MHTADASGCKSNYSGSVCNPTCRGHRGRPIPLVGNRDRDITCADLFNVVLLGKQTDLIIS